MLLARQLRKLLKMLKDLSTTNLPIAINLSVVPMETVERRPLQNHHTRKRTLMQDSIIPSLNANRQIAMVTIFLRVAHRVIQTYLYLLKI